MSLTDYSTQEVLKFPEDQELFLHHAGKLSFLLRKFQPGNQLGQTGVERTRRSICPEHEIRILIVSSWVPAVPRNQRRHHPSRKFQAHELATAMMKIWNTDG